MMTREASTISLRIRMNHDLSREEQIKSGRYDWVDTRINEEHFPKHPLKYGIELITVSLVCFQRSTDKHEPRELLAKLGYRLAKTTEILALGEQHPYVQKKCPITSLGDLWRAPDGRRYGLRLDAEAGNRRILMLDWIEGGWFPNFYFLGIKEARNVEIR